MSQVLHRTPIEIQKAGWEALKKQLGLPGHKISFAVRKGRGRLYPVKKKDLQGKTVKSLINEMNKERKFSVRKD